MLWLRWPLLLAGLFALVVFQTSASPSFPIFGVGPQAVVIVLCCWALVRPPIETLVMIPLAGVGLGLLAFQGMPESVAALAPIGLAALTWDIRRREHGPISPALEWGAAIALIGAASVLHFVAHAVAVELTTTGVNWLAALRTVLVGGVAGNMVVGAVVYWFVRIPSARIEGPAASAGATWT